MVASGPSAATIELDRGLGRAQFVAVNRSITLAPWASLWYCCDYQWWAKYFGDKAFRTEVGEYPHTIKVCVDYRIRECKEWNVKFLYCDKQDDTISWQPGRLGWGGNSGFNCLNMVAQFNPAKIILVGFDMSRAKGAHWHDPHPKGLSNPTVQSVERWRRVMENAAPVFVAAGITVINCGGEFSVLKKYPKLSFDEALEYDGPPWIPPSHTQVHIPVDPIVVAARRAEAEARVRSAIARTGQRNISDRQVQILVDRLAARL